MDGEHGRSFIESAGRCRKRERTEISMNRRTHILCGIGLAAAVILVYAPTLGGGLIAWDDYEVIAESENHSLAEIWTSPVYDAWLPVYYTAIKVQAAIWGDSRAFGLHLANILLHVLNALLVLLVVRRVFERWDLAWGAAFLFALHPAATESVSWVAEHKGLLAFAFAGLAVLCFLAAIERCGKGRVGFHLLGLLLLSLGLMAKGSVLPVPLILVLLVVTLRWKERGARWIADLAPWVLLAIAFGVRHYLVALAEGPGRAAEGAEILPVFLADFAVAARYLRMLFLPFFGQSLVPDLQYEGLSRLQMLFGFVITALFVIALVMAFLKDRMLFLALAAVAVALAPYNNLLPRTTVLFAERYIYLALPAGAVAVALLLARLGRRGPLVTAAVVVVFGLFTLARSAVWSDPVGIFRDAVQKAENSWLAAAKLGDALKMEAERAQVDGGDVQAVLTEAVSVFKSAVELATGPAEEVRSRIDLAGALLVTGESGVEALKVLDPAIALFGQLDLERRDRLALDVHLNRGTALSILSQNEEAAAAYRLAAQSAPLDPRPLTGLAESFTRLGNLKEALKAAREAVALDDDDEAAVISLAQILYLQGEVGPAMAALTDHVDRNPRAVRAFCLCGELALALGRPADARRRFEAALKASPGYSRAMRGMAGAALMLAKDALFKGDRKKACGWAERAVAANPDDPAGPIFLAGLVENPDLAEALLSGAARLDGGERARDALAALRMRLALGHLDEGDRRAAEAAAKRALEAFPRTIDLGKGAALKAELELLQDYLKDNPGPGDTGVLIGVILFAGGRFGEAERELGQAYRDAINDGLTGTVSKLALLFRGRSRLESGDRDGALTDFELLADLSPKDPWPQLNIADALVRTALIEQSEGLKEEREPRTEELFARARAAAEKAVELAPERMEPILRLGEIEFAAGRYLESLSLFARARREHPLRTEPRLDLAGLYKTHFLLTEDRQYLRGAQEELEAALEMDSGNARARAALGEILFMGMQTRRAARELARAVAEDPSLIQARVILASLYVRSGRSRLDGGGPEAVAQGARFAQLALALDSNRAGPHLLMADVLRVRKDFGPAQEHLEKARSLDPKSPEVKDGLARYHKDLGFAYLLKSRKEDALLQFEKALATEAQNVDLDQIRAILKLDDPLSAVAETPVDSKVAEILKERTERAGEKFKRAVELHAERDFEGAVRAILESLTARESAEGRCVLGQIRRDQGKNKEAERAFRAALAQKPGLHQAWLYLGSILYFQGDDAGALECYENYLHLSGDEESLETRAQVEVKVKELRATLDGDTRK